MLIKDLRVKNFKCFRDFEIKGLKRINLLGGDNNTGKTALLEAIYLHKLIKPSKFLLDEIARMRIGRVRLNREDMGIAFYIENLTNYSVPNNEISLSLNIENKGKRELNLEFLQDFSNVNGDQTDLIETDLNEVSGFDAVKLEYKLNGKSIIDDVFPIDKYVRRTFSSAKMESIFNKVELKIVSSRSTYRISDSDIAVLYSEYTRKDTTKNGIINILQAVFSDIRSCDIQLWPSKDAYLSIEKNDGGSHHIGSYGEGLRKCFEYILNAATYNDSLYLIDEFDNGIYYSRLKVFWETLIKVASETDVQVFATTHSRECIEAAYLASVESGDKNLAYFDMQRREGKIEAIPYDEEELGVALERGWGVR